VTLLALLLGYPIAYAASAAPKAWSIIILALVVLPFLDQRAGAGLCLARAVATDRGHQPAAAAVRLIGEPLALVHNSFGTIVATLHILLPFMVLPLYATMQKIPRDLLQAGASLGAGPLHTFWRIFFAALAAGVLAGSTLVFVLSLGFYITPELLGGGRTIMVSMLVSRNVELYDQWGAASAVGVVLLMAVAAIFLLVSRFVPLDRVLGQK